MRTRASAGIRHGFDADHLAAIDSLARLSSRERRGHARRCGALFSLGHGAIVLGIAAGAGMLSERWAPPSGLDAFGAWVSIAFLLLVGIANLRTVLTTAHGSLVPLIGIKGPFVVWVIAISYLMAKALARGANPERAPA